MIVAFQGFLPGMMMSRIKRTALSGFSKFLVLYFCLCALFCFAQTSSSDSPVILDGKTVITVHWGFGNSTSEARANAIATRLEAVAEDHAIPLKLTLQRSPLTIDIHCGDTILASVYTGDAQAENTTEEALALQWSRSFRTSMQAYRDKYGWRQMAIRGGVGLLIIALCIWLFILMRRYANRIAATTSAAIQSKIKDAQPQIAGLFSRTMMREMLVRLFAILRLVLVLIIAAVFIQALLGIFPQTRSLAATIYRGVELPVYSLFHAFWINLPSLLFILILAIVTWYLLRLVRYFFCKVAEGSISFKGFNPAWSTVTARLINIGLAVLAVLIAYPYIPGSGSAAFKGVSIFLGILVSLGSTGLVANVITGIMLTYTNAFEIGDMVEIGDFQGYVKRTSLLTTRLVTRKNEIITVPNSYIMSRQIKNYGSHRGEDSILISASVGVGYDSPWRQIEAMLMQAAARTESVLKDPPPFTLALSLDDYNVRYEVNAYLKPGVIPYVGSSELNRNVLDIFNEYGISLLSPSYRADPPKPKLVSKENWYTTPANPEQKPAPEERDYPPTRS
jgi:small-conductance mechanosensitive channel